LRGARATLGWTVGELARRTNVHRPTIRKTEKAEADPQTMTIRQIVAALIAGEIELQHGGVRLTRRE
jgi:predicted transcriptional regulator